ncbi:flagellar hook protein FliD [Bordetella genomosp. 1]|uniref:Flagellar hook-associated protein 2 n=1 Tax=Bordetella genomosp. 1 TaxID=1395607 RepID=A0A261SDL4_9BORD|nr:flagellar filament capping protein FliD [Bordetella genomosp. 1]OZI35151.1 flagellar hook protein FliD [Bordetella genomosp. 1]
MATITSLGSSGFPLQETLDKLQKAEEQRLTLISNQQSSFETKISAYSKLQSAIEAVQKAAAALGTSALSAVKSTVSDDKSVTVKTAAGAVPGSYNIKVESLATAQTLQSGSFTDRMAQNGAGGTLEVKLGDGTTKKIELGSDTSLNGIVKTINTSDDLGLSATVINDGNGNNFLMITSKTEGTDASVAQLEITGNTTLAGKLNFDVNDLANSKLTVQTEAKNAKLEVNGVAVTSQTNTVDSVVDNVTFVLNKVPEADVKVTISADTAAASTAVQNFVKAYNSLQTTISDLTKFDVTAETQSALTGDGTTRSIQNSIAGALRVATSEGDLRTLSALGITTDVKTGQITLDQEKLDKALAENPADVRRILSGTDGLTEKMASVTDTILGSKGSIKNRTEGLQETIATLKKQYDSTKASITATMDAYRAQFVKLDAMVVQMNGTSSYLQQQFANLSKSTS